MNKLLDLLFFIGVIKALVYYTIRYKSLLLVTIICGIIRWCFYLVIQSQQYKSIMRYIMIFCTLALIKMLYLQETTNITYTFLLMSHIGLSLYLVENKQSFNVYRFIYSLLVVILLVYFL